jgi:preprotein translocase subunit YajC
MSALLLPMYIVIFLGLIYLVGIRPQQKRRRELEALMSRLAPGDEVVTVAGIYGTVTEIEDGETLLLEIAEDTDIRIAKGSIARVVSDRASAVAPESSAAPDAGT